MSSFRILTRIVAPSTHVLVVGVGVGGGGGGGDAGLSRV